MQLLAVWKLSKKQQIGAFFKTKVAVVIHSFYNIFYIVAAVVKVAVSGNGDSVFELRCADIGYLGQAYKYTFSVYITQPPFNVVF